jgi:geranylgeranyl pyrophosphate synthase
VSATQLAAWLAECRARIDDYLDKALPPAGEPPERLHEAMRYAVLGEAKRLRPALAFGAAAACGGEPDTVLPVAAAAELVHSYSLVHDDLPAMDNDDERRGRPTVHVEFDEATAILVGDGLLAAAFEQLGGAAVSPDVVVRLAQAAGSRALVGGQADDLALAHGAATRASVRAIHERKTAALFAFAVFGGARVCAAEPTKLQALEEFALHYGLAFQATDDLLDARTDECSILLVMSEPEARTEIAKQAEAAVAALAPFGGRAAALRGLAVTVAARLP